uniref:Uncharacterized protein n=1 Tax=Molossus molossus TaxID=27622 RepID=A0A7J8I9I1_MOLMO|nr:hypothetical protein HJG59_010569 [Molossus molossus]
MFLGKECCYFVNQSGIITQKVKELRENIKHRAKELEIWNWGIDSQGWLQWLLPLIGPTAIILLGVSLRPCIIRTIVQTLKFTVTRWPWPKYWPSNSISTDSNSYKGLKTQIIAANSIKHGGMIEEVNCHFRKSKYPGDN